MTLAFLLDTNVVSELRKKVPNPLVDEWSDRHGSADFFISSLVVGEVRSGVEKLRPRDPERAAQLERWLGTLIEEFRDRILPVTTEVAAEWGRIHASIGGPPIDNLMAATASVHRLTLATRNVADVSRTGVPVVNPFDG